MVNNDKSSCRNAETLTACSQELAKQLNSDVLYKLQEEGVKLFLISIGPPERGFKFHELTGFPNEYMLADPENVTYSALGFKDDTISAFFSPEVGDCSISWH